MESLAPVYAGLTREVLLSHRDGVVVPCDPATLEDEATAHGLRPVEAVEVRAAAVQSQVASSDIQAVPGPEAVPAGPIGGWSTEEQAEEDDGEASAPEESATSRPALLTWAAGEVLTLEQAIDGVHSMVSPCRRATS